MNPQTLSPVNKASNVADTAANGAQEALRSTQSVANKAFDRLGSGIESAREHAVPLIDRLSDQAQATARRGADAVRDTSAQVRDKALIASESTVGYIRDKPVKAMLIAAATGAALMALIGLLGRTRSAD